MIFGSKTRLTGRCEEDERSQKVESKFVLFKGLFCSILISYIGISLMLFNYL